MKVFGIVGWKNSGKTSLMERLIAHFSTQGLRVSAIKRAHHQVDLDQPGRDSYRYRQAGACQVMLATAERMALMQEHHGHVAPSLQQLLHQMQPCDLVLVEGFKNEGHNKLEVIRQVKSDGFLHRQLTHVLAVATDQHDLDLTLPKLDLNDTVAIAEFILATEYTESDYDIKSHDSKVDDCFNQAHNLLSAPAAYERLRKVANVAVDSMQLPVTEVYNKRLAVNLISTHDSPRFDNAAVDGYACNHNDLIQHGYCLQLADIEASAGSSAGQVLQSGQCIRILTGARLPQGADTVVMQEAITRRDQWIVFPTDVKANINWRSRGEDIKQGDVILSQGQVLRPQDIGLAVAAGYCKLTVYQPLKVALFSTGNELRDAGETLSVDQIHDVNRYILRGILANYHCQVTDLGILADDPDVIQQALTQASHIHHLIITSGGAATGSHDHVGAVLAKQGQIHFWRLAIKPGRPLAFGGFGTALFLGLPGNPVAAAVCCLMFGGPLIHAMAGGGWRLPTRYRQTLGFDLHKKMGRREWVRVKRAMLSNGQIVLQKSASQGSGILTSMTQADGLVELDEATTSLPAGSQVDFIPFSTMGLLER